MVQSRSLLPLAAVLTLALAGCKNREAQVPGTWTGSGNSSVSLTADKKFTGQVGIFPITGHWTLEGDDVVLTKDTIAGKPVADVKKSAQSVMGRLPLQGAQAAQMKQSVEDIDKPNYLKLDSDGKTMTTDKEKDKNSGQGMTLTKQGA